MRRLILLVVLYLIVMLSCWGTPDPESHSEKKRPNVVLYVIDTLRADRLGVYGRAAERPLVRTSPNIDEFASSGIVFEQAVAPAPWTLPSMASVFLSQFPCEHGLLNDGDRLSDGKTLASALSELGYRTGAFYENPYVGEMSKLDQGYKKSLLIGTGEVEPIDAWLDAQDPNSPFFLYVHTVEPHNPESAKNIDVIDEVREEVELAYRSYRNLTRVDYEKGLALGTTDNTEEQQKALDKLNSIKDTVSLLYDAAVSDADSRFGYLWKRLKKDGFQENTLFVLVSDHGEELGDRGGWQHDHSVYEELVHVPLIIRLPKKERSGERIGKPVSLIDIGPTILNYLGAEVTPTFRGQDLLGVERNEPRFMALRDNRKKYFKPYKRTRGDINVVVRDGSWKGIWNKEPAVFELYDLKKGFSEMANLQDIHPEISKKLKGFAQQSLEQCRGEFISTEAEESTLDEETLRRLCALGYLGKKE